MPFRSTTTAAPNGLSAAPAAVAGWLGVALWNSVRITLSPLGPGGFGVRLGHLVIDLGHTLAIGLLVGGVILGYRRLPVRRVWDYLVVALVAIGLGQVVLVPDLEGAIERWTDGTGGPWLVRGAAAMVALAVPACFFLGLLAVRYRLRWAAAATASVVIASNDRILTNGYPGAHVLMATCGATLLGTALYGLRVRFLSAGRSSLRGKLLIGAATLVSFGTLILPASARVRIELVQRDTALLAPWLGTLDTPASDAPVDIPKELATWYEPRRRRPEVPPSSFRPLPPNPIVVLVTIDALRMELMDAKFERVAPNLHEMRKHAVYFSQARSSGSDTRFSLATLFSGRHMSTMKWNWRSRLRPTLENDRAPRLPELLERGDVTTVTGIALPNMLVPRIGIVRGFSEEFFKNEAEEGGATIQIVNHAIERLRHQGPEPLFYFTHLIDPHVPYRKHGKRAKTQYDAYLLEVEFVDGHLGRLRRAIRELGLEHRTALIVSSDHGEGFGEHGIYHHNKALYDVMVHVPLMFEIPGVEPRTIDHHVSLMDVGPTILDLFGVPVPGSWVSESLVPFLAGKVEKTHRPIFMERPTEQAVLFHDGIKVMLRQKPDVEEIYDLRSDPNELDNLRDALGAEGDRRVALARAYAKAHAGTRASGSQRGRDR